MNVASAAKFSSDRTIRQYAEEIWHIKPTEYEAPKHARFCKESGVFVYPKMSEPCAGRRIVV